LPEFGRYLGELLAFGVITLDTAQMVCGVKNAQGVLGITRGDRKPAHPTQTVQELRALYGEHLARAVSELKRNVAALEQGVVVAATASTGRPQPPASSTRLVLEAAGAFSALLPVARYMVVEATAEDRALLRRLLGDSEMGGMFELSGLLNQLCSERAKRSREVRP
jgi:hypothetical protein